MNNIDMLNHEQTNSNTMYDFKKDCLYAATNANLVAKDEIRLFCTIMGYSFTDIHFVGGDPHGIVCIGDDTYNMTDIHVVVSEYKRWLELYGSNEAIAKAVNEWYCWSLDWHENHPKMEWQDSTRNLPKVDKQGVSKVVLLYGKEYTDYAVFAWYCNTKRHPNEWHYRDNGYIGILSNNRKRYWLDAFFPDGTYCPNLRSWLLGCPVPGLREATPEFIEQKKRKQEKSRERIASTQTELEQAINEYNAGSVTGSVLA